MSITIQPKQKTAREYERDRKTPLLSRGRTIDEIVKDINRRMYGDVIQFKEV